MACNQPLAADAGISVLKRGGNAADAAVAVAAALSVTQPCSTGIGGDCFCLFYDAATRSVRGINGRCLYYVKFMLCLVGFHTTDGDKMNNQGPIESLVVV